MATIPVVRTPQSVTEPVRGAEQTIQPSPEAFGATGGRGLEKAGASMLEASADLAKVEAWRQQAASEAAERLKKREDSLNIIRATNALREKANELVLAEEKGGDLSSPGRVKALRDQLDAEFSKAEQAFVGQLPESRLLFMEDTAKLRAQFGDHITNKGIAAGKAAMDAEAKRVMAGLGGLVSSNPAALADAQAQWTDWVARRYAGTADPAEEQAQFQAGMETLATNAADFLIKAQKYDDALALMASPTVQPHLSPDRARELRLRIYSGQGEAEKTRAAAQTKIDLLKGMGIPVTPAMAASIVSGMNLMPQRSGQTLAEKINEARDVLRIATGNPTAELSQAQIEKLSGTYLGAERESDPFSRTGALRFLAENAELVRSGRATPEQLNRYVFMAGVAQQEDALTKTRIDLPLPVREALEAAGIPAQVVARQEGVAALQAARARLGQVTPTGLPADAPTRSNAVAHEIKSLGRSRGEVLDAYRMPDGSVDADRAVAALRAQGVKFYDEAERLTGLLSSITDQFDRRELIGRIINTPEINTLRAAYELLPEKLARAFKEGDREADAERKGIIQRFERIRGGFFTAPDALQSGMVGLDDALARSLLHAQEALKKEGNLSSERARNLIDRIDIIKEVRDLMGVPPLVNSKEEYYEVVRERGLGPGDKVRWKGKVITIPGAQ